jgi:serine protease AprX
MDHLAPSISGVAWNDEKRRGRRPAVVGAAVVGLLAGGLALAPAALAATPENSGTPTSVVVRALPGHLSDAQASVRAAGGTVRRTMDSLETVSATVPASALPVLRHGAGVASVSVNGKVTLSADTGSYNAANDANSIFHSLGSMGAQRYYAAGMTGKGVDIALIDSGVTAVPGLDAPGKVVKGPDLSEEGQVPNLDGMDTNGHGTFMAGLIAGKDGNGLRDAKYFLGAAPDARIISVKAADAIGATDVSQVLAGIDWVVQHKNDNGMNIRVLNLSFGTTSTQSYLLDPLAYAVEVAWRHGIFVVVSAGNHGTTLNSLTSPAINPFVMAVGAEDTNNTINRSDDTIPSFSSYGTETRKPDLVAPGKSVTSLRVPGSYLDSTYPAARVGDRFFRGSGTSQAAAYVSGAAALVLQQRPTLTPDQLKDLFKGTASRLQSADSLAQGAGAVNLSALYSKAVNPLAVQVFAPATGLGSLEAARGSDHLSMNGVELRGEKDIFGNDFSSAVWAPMSAAGTSWNGGTWNGSTWTGPGWSSSGLSWSGVSWSGVSWSGVSWSGVSWSGVSWSGVSWSGVSWSGVSWSGVSWSGVSWSSTDWA